MYEKQNYRFEFYSNLYETFKTHAWFQKMKEDEEDIGASK